jgi:hypothetical protein
MWEACLNCYLAGQVELYAATMGGVMQILTLRRCASARHRREHAGVRV